MSSSTRFNLKPSCTSARRVPADHPTPVRFSNMAWSMTISGWWFQPIISQLGWLFPIYGKIKNVPNHQPDMVGVDCGCRGTKLLMLKPCVGMICVMSSSDNFLGEIQHALAAKRGWEQKKDSGSKSIVISMCCSKMRMNRSNTGYRRCSFLSQMRAKHKEATKKRSSVASKSLTEIWIP